MRIFLWGPGLSRYEEPIEWFYIRALQSLGHEVTLSPTGRIDLSIIVKQAGANAVVPQPRVLIFSDLTERFPEVYEGMKPIFRKVFLVHNERRVDNKDVFYLPVGFDPGIHKRIETEKTRDLVFIGTYREERAWIADLDIGGVKPEIYGNGWGEAGVKTKDVYGREKANICSSSKIILNHHYPGDTENMRLHEAMGYGSLQITDNPGTYLDGRELVTYHTTKQLEREVIKYLDDDAQRELIALQGHLKANLNHTYAHRMKEMLEILKLEGLI